MWSVSPLTEAELAALVDIDTRAFPDASLTQEYREANLLGEMRRPFSICLGARGADGRLAGYLVAWQVETELHLLNIATDETQRQRGVGSQLMHALLLEAQRRSCTQIFLEVRTGNTPAIALYERFQFERGRIRRGYYPNGEDALEMMRQLA